MDNVNGTEVLSGDAGSPSTTRQEAGSFTVVGLTICSANALVVSQSAWAGLDGNGCRFLEGSFVPQHHSASESVK